MPHFPLITAETRDLSDQVFSQLVERAKQLKTVSPDVELIPLHIGETVGPKLTTFEKVDSGKFTYAPPTGDPALLKALDERFRPLGYEPKNIQVSSGATPGLSHVAEAIVSAGDEVILPAPFWPLIRGIFKKRGAQVREIAGFMEMDPEAMIRALNETFNPKTVALYLNNPHNPTGTVLTEAQLDAIIAWAQEKKIWVITDEVYEDIYFSDTKPPSFFDPSRLPLIQEQLIAAFSFSKSYGIAGSRVGWVLSKAAASSIRACQTYSTYSSPRYMQDVCLQMMKQPHLLQEMRDECKVRAQLASEILGLKMPEGGTFLFFDLLPYGYTDAMPFLERCVDQGVLLTPGLSCGEAYRSWVRLCYTVTTRDLLTRGLGIVKKNMVKKNMR